MAFHSEQQNRSGLELAVVGMSGRFPNSPTLDDYWGNLAAGVDMVSFFGKEELAEEGVPAAVHEKENYVPARAVLDPEVYRQFDADFFDMSPREAELSDPQQRVFLECAWEALEDAACDPERVSGRIGVFASTTGSSYAHHNIASRLDLVSSVGQYQIRLYNEPDHLPTRVSYKLNLTGPSVNVQTACSSSLVAIHLAGQSLLSGDCDIVLVGGTSIVFPHRAGHLYQTGGIMSSDGRCRPFDARADGTTGGCGAGVVVLKRLADAETDGDSIYATVLGSAVNNDGSQKVGYTAPSVGGQIEVVRDAQRVAGVDPETITYVEAHGTGTALGDPIEVAALTQAFQPSTDRKQLCALGSVKSNIGHLDAAAGVAGFIKTVLALQNRQIPPTAHFDTPNPDLDLESSPFYVPNELVEWEVENLPRRAGVTSLGIGGTNAHVVLEEAPPHPQSEAPNRDVQLFVLSAKSSSALKDASARLARHLDEWHVKASEPSPSKLADVAYTLQTGRTRFSHRRAVVAEHAAEARAAVMVDDGVSHVASSADASPDVAFLFPGQGAQYTNMARDLYEREAVIQDVIDACSRHLLPELNFDLRTVLFSESEEVNSEERLKQTKITQPALFAVEVAVFRLWQTWGIEPAAVAGHSIGAFAAAHAAGMFSLEEGCRLVAARGRLMQGQPKGSMLALPVPADRVLPHLTPDCAVAARNTPTSCVVSGPNAAIDRIARQMQDSGVDGRRLHTSHAFHSPMMDPIVDAFRQVAKTVDWQVPRVPVVSCVTGAWLSNADATDPDYWARHLRQSVRYADAAETLLSAPRRVFLEVGPGRTLTTLARRHPKWSDGHDSVCSMRHPMQSGDDQRVALNALGTLWTRGVDPDWNRVHGKTSRCRLSLPTYPFERSEYWIEAVASDTADSSGDAIPAPGTGEPQRNGSPTDVPNAAQEEKPEHISQPDRHDAFEGPVEGVVADIWRQLLGVKEVGRKDEFFDLGGDSLMATRVVAHLQDAFDVEVTADLVYGDATVESIAREIRSLQRRRDDASNPVSVPLPPIAPVSHDEPLPLSFAQERLWSVDQMTSGGTAAYNMPLTARIRGPLDGGALFAAVRSIVMRHAVLRTTYTTVDHQPRQRVHNEPVFGWKQVDLRELPPFQRESACLRARQQTSRRPFDLAEGPILRGAHFVLGDDHSVVTIVVHHIASDGWSTSVLVEELSHLYPARASRVPDDLPVPAVQYADYAEWERRHRGDEAVQDALDQIRKRLDNAPRVCTIPSGRPRPARQTHNGAACEVVIPSEQADVLRQIAGDEKATLFMVLLAAYSLVLSRVIGRSDVVVGTNVAGRPTKATEVLIGFFVNRLALYVDTDGLRNFRDLVQAVKEEAEAAYAHQHVPFPQVVEALQSERDPAYPPLVQLTLTLRNQPRRPLHIDARASQDSEKLDLQFESDADRASIIDAALGLSETREGGLRGHLRYNADLYLRSTIERVVKQFQHVVERLADRPHQTLANLRDALDKAAELEEKERAADQRAADLRQLRHSSRRSAK